MIVGNSNRFGGRKVHVDEKISAIEELESIIMALKLWNEDNPISAEMEYKVGQIGSSEQRDEKIRLYNKSLKAIRVEMPIKDKLYLSEIIKKENIEIDGTNNLILAPVGSGKTTFIHSIIKKDPSTCLMLVSNTALKDNISPEENSIRKLKSNQTYTTRNKSVYGSEEYKIHVMSYSEFGRRVKTMDDFLEGFKYIFCDEIHSLPNFQKFQDSTVLSHAIKTLFNKHSDKKIYYFTATEEYLLQYEKSNPNIMRNVTRYDFRNHPDIRKYMPLSEYQFYHIEQIRMHLKSRVETFKYFGYKTLAFSRTIEGQRKIESIAKEEGFKPLVLWSVNNKKEGFKMTKEQLDSREHLLKEGLIPEPYDMLIINSSMQEGWDLFDPKVKLAIMNTTSETERIQAVGRLRSDIDILAYKVKFKKGLKDNFEVNIPEKYLDIPLTKVDKDKLIVSLNLRTHKGKLMKWSSLKNILDSNDSNYILIEGTKTLDSKRVRTLTISKKDDLE